MQPARHLLAQRYLIVLICAAALLLKLLVPSGYMVDSAHGRLTITICSGTTPAIKAMEMPAMHGDMPDHGKSDGHGEVEMPCAFSGLSASALGAIDPIQLAGLIAFVLTLGFVAIILPAPERPAYLRPPSRGPPASL